MVPIVDVFESCVCKGVDTNTSSEKIYAHGYSSSEPSLMGLTKLWKDSSTPLPPPQMSGKIKWSYSEYGIVFK